MGGERILCQVITVKLLLVGGGGLWGGQVQDSHLCYSWPLAHIFPPLMLVMLGFYYAGKEEKLL